MKKNNYVKAVYEVFFIGLILSVSVVFLLLKYVNLNVFFGTYNSYGDFLYPSYIVIGFFISNSVMDIFESRLKKEKGGRILFGLYVIVTIIFNVFSAAMTGFIALCFKYMHFPNVIYQALLSVTVVFGVATFFGIKSKTSDKNHPILNSIFISSVIVLFINLFIESNLISIIVDIVSIICVSAFVYYDAIKIKSRLASREISENKKILYYTYVLSDATNLVMDFTMLWEDIADLIFKSQSDDD